MEKKENLTNILPTKDKTNEDFELKDTVVINNEAKLRTIVRDFLEKKYKFILCNLLKNIDFYNPEDNKVNYMKEIYCVSAFNNKLMFKRKDPMLHSIETMDKNDEDNFSLHQLELIKDRDEYLERISKINNPCFMNYNTRMSLNIKGKAREGERNSLYNEFKEFTDITLEEELYYSVYDVLNKRLDFTPDECIHAEFFRYKYDKFKVTYGDDKVRELLLNDSEMKKIADENKKDLPWMEAAKNKSKSIKTKKLSSIDLNTYTIISE